MKNHLLLAGAAACALSCSSHAATVTVAAGTYTENFNNMTTTQEPAPGWDVRSASSGTSIGTFASRRRLLASAAPFAWSEVGGAIRNVSSNNISPTSDAQQQAANTNRALGIVQGPTFGDPGAGINFNFSSTGVLFNSISIDLLLLNDLTPSTTYSIQYGIGTSPTSFVTLATWSDQSVAGGWGGTTFTFDRDDFGADLDNQSQAWFRVVTLTPAANDTSSGNYDHVAIDNFSISASAIPEPSTMLLGCLGVLGVLGLLRARRR